MKAITLPKLKLLLLIIFLLSVTTTDHEGILADELDLVNLEVHTPMYLNGNTKVIQKAAEEGWKGSGTEEDPYLIENYKFDGNNEINSENKIAKWDVVNHIEISFSDVNVVIQNNYFEDGIEGVTLINSSNIEIRGNTFTGMSNGIALVKSFDIDVVDNIFTEFRHPYESGDVLMGLIDHRLVFVGFGLHLSQSFNIYVVNNHFTTNGIFGRSVINMFIWENTFNNHVGYYSAVDFWNVKQIQIISNEFTNVSNGMNFLASSDVLVLDNTFLNTGTAISFGIYTLKWVGEHGYNHKIIGNHINNASTAISIHDNYNTTVRGNEIQNSREYGIYMSQLGDENHNTSTLRWTDYSIDDENDIYNTISENVLTNNYQGMQIDLYPGFDPYYMPPGPLDFRSTINQNNFINNAKQIDFSERDDGGFNRDYTGEILAGRLDDNHWTDYTSPDDDSNGIVDNPYTISTGFDNSPKATPFDIDREAINELYYPEGYEPYETTDNEDPESELILPQSALAVAGIGALTLLGGASFYYYSQGIPKGIVGGSPNNGIDSIISSIFSTKSAGFMVLGNKIVNQEDLTDELKKAIPEEIMEYKFLMNPVRISICKLLIDSMDLPTKNVKEALNVSWSNYSTHSKALKDQGLIETFSKFVDGIEVQFISITPEGERRYKELTGILHELLDNTYLYETYLDTALSIAETYDQPLIEDHTTD